MSERAIITAFEWVPSFARGLVRDLRVRWMFEEIGEGYDVRYLSQGEQKQAAHRALQPYGQVPTLEDGEVTLFESGAIVLHLSETRDRLLPGDPQGRARAIEWLFAALNTVEPTLSDLALVNIFEFDQPWSEARRPSVEERIRERLGETAAKLEGREWFDGEFSIGDLMMVSVLRIIGDNPLLAEYPTLADYVARGEARPAFQRALAAQLAGFTGSVPPQFEEWLRKWEAAQKNEPAGSPAPAKQGEHA
jgi:glutathione S-transferase